MDASKGGMYPMSCLNLNFPGDHNRGELRNFSFIEDRGPTAAASAAPTPAYSTTVTAAVINEDSSSRVSSPPSPSICDDSPAAAAAASTVHFPGLSHRSPLMTQFQKFALKHHCMALSKGVPHPGGTKVQNLSCLRFDSVTGA